MTKTDSELGQKVKEHLTRLGLETQLGVVKPFAARTYLEEGVRGFLNGMGLKPDEDPSIMDTPRRVSSMFVEELCYGLNYDNFPKCTTQPNGVPIPNPQHTNIGGEITELEGAPYYLGAVDEMVVVDSIQTISLCEHHFQTIHGHTHIAYLPGTKLLGLSKFARVVNFFARRPQVQERMTEQIYAALSFILDTGDIGVVQRAVHNCMRARGAMDPSSKTTTSKMGGRFRENPATRAEFLAGIPSS